MIQELIDKIAEAEKKADETVAAAHEEAREISLNAEAEAAKIIASAKALIKEERKSALEEAEAAAQKEFDAIIKKGEEEAKALCGNIDIAKEAAEIALEYYKLHER
jgi:vacuolar-type H+-ATPase subunit H